MCRSFTILDLNFGPVWHRFRTSETVWCVVLKDDVYFSGVLLAFKWWVPRHLSPTSILDPLYLISPTTSSPQFELRINLGNFPSRSWTLSSSKLCKTSLLSTSVVYDSFRGRSLWSLSSSILYSCVSPRHPPGRHPFPSLVSDLLVSTDLLLSSLCRLRRWPVVHSSSFVPLFLPFLLSFPPFFPLCGLFTVTVNQIHA